jgi:sarcosine oxidase subunit gamma
VTTSAARRSPLHNALEHLHPKWIQIHGMPAALHFDDSAHEAEQARALALCDVSVLPRIGIKGRGGEAWLVKHGISVPNKLYGHAFLPSGEGLILRTGTSELFIEDGIGGDVVSKLWAEPDSALPDVYRFHRQDAAMLLSGERAWEVLAETCGYNFREPDVDLVFTRVAGVSCCILRKDRDGMSLFRIWCDGSFGDYLWEQLHEITREHDGTAVGMLAHYPSLS